MNATPSERDLERWSRQIEKAEAVQLARDLGAQIKAGGEVRLAEQEGLWRRLEDEARGRAPEGSPGLRRVRTRSIRSRPRNSGG